MYVYYQIQQVNGEYNISIYDTEAQRSLVFTLDDLPSKKMEFKKAERLHAVPQEKYGLKKANIDPIVFNGIFNSLQILSDPNERDRPKARDLLTNIRGLELQLRSQLPQLTPQ